MTAFEELNAERAWALTVGALTLGFLAGSVLFRKAVYAEFVWHYFWGPVYADANGAACAVWNGGARTLHSSSAACQAATEPVAYPGYTIVSEIGYMLILLLMAGGVILMLRRLQVGTDRTLFFALFPFMLFGGALRVVEDANDAVPAGADPILAYPWNTLIISPIIYFTMFAITMSVGLTSLWLGRTGRTDGYARPLFVGGTVLLSLTVLFLGYAAASTEYVGFYPVVTVLTLLVATGATALVWVAIERFAPAITEGTGYIGGVVIWGHAVDGTANVIGIDWGEELGLPYGDLVPKHPVNQAVIDLSHAVFPGAVTDVIGVTWPFLLLKLAAATLAVWLFNEEIMEESPRYSVLLLIVILAVGLGPGTRDMLRATFGI